MFSEVIKRVDIEREPLEEKDATVNRDQSEIQKMQPFPYKFFVGQSWPVRGSTILYGESVICRWEGELPDKTPRSSAKIKLVIAEAEKEICKPVEKSMEIGEFIRINADEFNEGTSYEWYVTADGSVCSDHYPFGILKKEVSENIRSKLREVGLKFAGRSPELMQALYLQILSDTTPGLDLYADSFRILTEYSEISGLNKVLEGIFSHKVRNE